MSLRKDAQKRVKQWKKDRLFGWEIQKMTKVDEAAISKIFTGKGIVSDAMCQKILDAKEVAK